MSELECSNCKSPYGIFSLEKGMCVQCGTPINEEKVEGKPKTEKAIIDNHYVKKFSSKIKSRIVPFLIVIGIFYLVVQSESGEDFFIILFFSLFIFLTLFGPVIISITIFLLLYRYFPNLSKYLDALLSIVYLLILLIYINEEDILFGPSVPWLQSGWFPFVFVISFTVLIGYRIIIHIKNYKSKTSLA